MGKKDTRARQRMTMWSNRSFSFFLKKARSADPLERDPRGGERPSAATTTTTTTAAAKEGKRHRRALLARMIRLGHGLVRSVGRMYRLVRGDGGANDNNKDDDQRPEPRPCSGGVDVRSGRGLMAWRDWPFVGADCAHRRATSFDQRRDSLADLFACYLDAHVVWMQTASLPVCAIAVPSSDGSDADGDGGGAGCLNCMDSERLSLYHYRYTVSTRGDGRDPHLYTSAVWWSPDLDCDDDDDDDDGNAHVARQENVKARADDDHGASAFRVDVASSAARLCRDGEWIHDAPALTWTGSVAAIGHQLERIEDVAHRVHAILCFRPADSCAGARIALPFHVDPDTGLAMPCPSS